MSLTELAQPDGLAHGLNRAAILLGIVAFGMAAAQIAGEYGLGTRRSHGQVGPGPAGGQGQRTPTTTSLARRRR